MLQIRQKDPTAALVERDRNKLERTLAQAQKEKNMLIQSHDSLRFVDRMQRDSQRRHQSIKRL